MRAFAAIVAASVLAGCSATGHDEPEIAVARAAEEVSAWRSVDSSTGKIRDIAGLDQLARDFPDSGSVRLRLLSAQVATERYQDALQTLEWLYDRGYVFSDAGQQQIEQALASVDPGRIAERLRAESERIENSTAVASVPVGALLVESVIRNPVDERLLATSVVGKAVWGETGSNDFEPYLPASADNLSGIVFDADRNAFWVASGNIDQSDEDSPGFAGLIRLDARGDFSVRLKAPTGGAPSDLAIGPRGDLYASDPLNGSIYHGREGMPELKELVAPGRLRSPQGIAPSFDGMRLYVSDYRYGIAIIDLTSGTASRLSTDLPILLDGIDGLWRYGDELIGVQNGTSPMKIVALKLDREGRRVVDYRVLEQAHSEWTEPLGGAIDGEELLYVATGQWDRFRNGKPLEDNPPTATQIRSLPLLVRNR